MRLISFKKIIFVLISNLETLSVKATLILNSSPVLYKRVCTYEFSGGLPHLHSTPVLREGRFLLPSSQQGSSLVHFCIKSGLSRPKLTCFFYWKCCVGRSSVLRLIPHTPGIPQKRKSAPPGFRKPQKKSHLWCWFSAQGSFFHLVSSICKFFNFKAIQQFGFKIHS